MDPLLSAAEAAALVNVKPATIRQWVRRGYLAPDYPAWASEVRFRESKVIACAEQRRPKTELARLETLAAQWRRVAGQ